MKLLKSYLFLIAFMGSLSSTYAQDPLNEMDKKYVPPVGSLFDSKKGSLSEAIDYPKNLIKFNVSALSHGIGALEYEREIIDKISVTVAGGVTVFPDYVLFVRDLLTNDVLEDPYFDSPGTHFAIGVHYNLDRAAEGGYLELKFRNTVHNYTSSRVNRFYEQISREYLLGYGGSTFGNSILGEIAFGVGIRQLDTKRIRSSNQLRTYDELQFFGYFTINLGFGL